MSSVRIDVRNLRVLSLSVDFNEVVWEVAPTSEDVLDYTFQLLRSESPAGPFEEAMPPVEDRYFFVDNRIKAFNRWRQYFYKLVVTHKPSEESKDFGPVSLGGEPDLLALELRKHFNLLMREFVGRRCWVLPVRTFGQRCSCVNPHLKKRTRSGCPTCFDTGWVRGYHSPIETFIQVDPSPKANQQTNLGELQQQNTTGRMGYFPPLKPKDVIIEPENRRWSVVQVSTTQRLRAVVHQEIQIHEIPKSSAEYAIDINLGTGTVKTWRGEEQKAIRVHDLFLAGSRNNTNPQNLKNFEDEEIPGIFSLYPTTYGKVAT